MQTVATMSTAITVVVAEVGGGLHLKYELFRQKGRRYVYHAHPPTLDGISVSAADNTAVNTFLHTQLNPQVCTVLIAAVIVHPPLIAAAK